MVVVPVDGTEEWPENLFVRVSAAVHVNAPKAFVVDAVCALKVRGPVSRYLRVP